MEFPIDIIREPLKNLREGFDCFCMIYADHFESLKNKYEYNQFFKDVDSKIQKEDEVLVKQIDKFYEDIEDYDQFYTGMRFAIAYLKYKYNMKYKEILTLLVKLERRVKIIYPDYAAQVLVETEIHNETDIKRIHLDTD